MANEAELDDCIWIDEPDCKPIDDLVKIGQMVAALARKRIEDHFEAMKGTEWFAENVADEIRAFAEVWTRK